LANGPFDPDWIGGDIYMLDPSGGKSRNFTQFQEKDCGSRFQSGNLILQVLIALTLAFVTCYFQWS
jgi:hypothetical protein